MAAWETFCQAEKLTTRIHNILREYPPGLGTFKEFLQNADDAKASHFTIIYDQMNHRSSSLLSPSMGEWQGPSLNVYNSAIFTDADFEGITQVGNSGKVSDPTTIGKYGLGFNCSYHFSDLVSFISHDQIIYFDPHGKFLPENVLGLRSNFVNLVSSTSCSDLLEPYRFECLGSQEVPFSPVQGTIFRLPLRSKEQASKSLLSNVHYTPKELVELITQFGKEAGEMILFLNHIEDVKVYIRNSNGEIKQLSHIFISNMTDTLREKRRSRNLPPEEAKGSVQSTLYQLCITEIYDNERREDSWLVSSISQCRELSEMEKLIDSSATLQWVNVATCFTKKIESGTVYCSLPLPMKTGYPVHINGNFALSSNRRHLWEQSDNEQSGPATFKSQWNKELTSLMTPAYVTLLESLKKSFPKSPETLYAYWPNSSQSHFFQQYFLPHFIQYLQEEHPKLFWDGRENRWLPLSDIFFPDDALPMDDPLYSTLHSIHVRTVFPPSSILFMLRTCLPMPILSPKNLIAFLKILNRKMITSAIAGHLLHYLLRGVQDRTENQVKSYLKEMEGLPIIPLIKNNVGTIQPLAKIQSNSIYLLCEKSEHMAVLPHCDRMIDMSSICYDKLSSLHFIQKYSNIKKFTPSILPYFMSFIVPTSWHNIASVYVSGDLLKEQVLNISQAHLKHKKKKIKQIPSGLQSARDPSIDLIALKKQLNLLWKFIGDLLPDGSFVNGLNSWPIVLVSTPDGEMVCTIDTCRRKGVLSSDTIKQYGVDAVRVLRKYGCLFYDQKGSVLKKVIGKRKKMESLDSIIRYLSLHREISITSEDSLVLRTIVLMWINKKQTGGIVTKQQIVALPLFLNIAGSMALKITSKNTILPPEGTWYETCAKAFPHQTIDMKRADNQQLLAKVVSNAPSLKSFLTNHICPIISSLPQAVCLEFLREIGKMQNSDSPWFATQNKENNEIIKTLETKEIIVFDDGYRCSITKIFDTSNTLLSDVFSSTVNQYSFAPECYRSDPLIQKVLRRLPVLSLVDFNIFVEVANQAASKCDVQKGMILIMFLSKSHHLLKWSSPQYRQLSTIPFSPCWDLTQQNFSEVENILYTNPTHLCSFIDGFLMEERVISWTQGPIFCQEISQFTSKFQTQVSIRRSIPTKMLLSHLHIIQRKCTPMVPESQRKSYVEIVSCVCNRLNQTLKKNAKKKSFVEIRHSLCACRFVMLESGDLVLPHQLCFDLEEDLGPFARAVPFYLRSYQKLFSVIGTPMISQAQAPIVGERGEKPLLSTLLVKARNTAVYSDVRFTWEDKEYFAHKLVVCPCCPVLESMFSSGFREASARAAVYPLPEWTNWDAFTMVMDYCYTGDWRYLRKLSPGREEDVSLITELLRLSDLFLMDHLKSCCEGFLSSVTIDVFNVCSLLEIAEMCNAQQLLEYCSFTIRLMFGVVKETEEWKNLSPSTQEMVLAGSLFNEQ